MRAPCAAFAWRIHGLSAPIRSHSLADRFGRARTPHPGTASGRINANVFVGATSRSTRRPTSASCVVGGQRGSRRPANHRRRRPRADQGRKAGPDWLRYPPVRRAGRAGPRGRQSPPLMIFEWDIVGGWHSLLSIVYRGAVTASTLPSQGYAAAASCAASATATASGVRAGASRYVRRHCDEASSIALSIRNVLSHTLAAWRETFSYYRWLDNGEAEAWTGGARAATAFASVPAQHVARFGNDLEFPAFDCSSATQAGTAAERGAWATARCRRRADRVIAFVACGSPLGRRSRIVCSTLRCAQKGW